MQAKILRDYQNHLRFVSNLSEATIESYLFDLDHLLNAVDRDFLNVSYSQIQDIFYEWSKEIAPTSLARRMSGIRYFYQYLLDTKEICSDPTQLVKVRGKSQKLPHYLTLEEVALLSSFELERYDDYLDKALIDVLFSCGLRVSELVSLTQSRFYQKEGFFKILGKGSKERIVPIGTSALNSLNQYFEHKPLKNSQWLFVNSKSLPLTRQSVYNRLRKRQQQTGLTKQVTPHVLRHSFASALINNDADLRVVQELLGHEVISTTQIYTHLENKTKKRMVDQFHPGQKLEKGSKSNE